MTSQRNKSGAAAVWVTVVVIIGLAIGAYFAWPQFMAYLDNLSVRNAVKANAVRCLPYNLGTEGCAEKMAKEASAQTGLQMLPEDFEISVAGKRVIVTVEYRTKLVYPFTGTMLGSSKDRFKRYRWTEKMESKYVM